MHDSKTGRKMKAKTPLIKDNIIMLSGATTETRTRDLYFTKVLLYQLSYSGK